MKYFYNIFLLVLFFLLSCSNETKELKYDDDTDFFTEEVEDNQDIVMYSLPNPLSVSYIIHTADIGFNEAYLTYYEREFISGEIDKDRLALQLGIVLVEFGYVTFYEKHQYSLTYLKKIEELLRTLDLQNQKTVNAISNLKNNISNRDSVYQVILDTYEEVGAELIEQKNDKIALHIANGIFLHSLYILSDVHDKMQIKYEFLENNGTMNDYRALLVQFKFFLDNFIELFAENQEQYQLEFDLLLDLRMEFKKMSMNYSYSQKEGEIQNVTFRKYNLIVIKDKILNFRKLQEL